ncbi:ANTAR domain-containing protein [Nocardia sp. NPDC051321]|uniref:ANTAR domain-containing protein n=1 Tax=Nocardia sp. NPDC051321 TaxID=3364323 RepID=UPI003794EE74
MQGAGDVSLDTETAVVVTVRGQLTASTLSRSTETLLPAMADSASSPSVAVVDLRYVRMLTSDCVPVLAQFARAERDIRIAFVLDPAEIAAQVLRLADPTSALPLFRTIDDAMSQKAAPFSIRDRATKSVPPTCGDAASEHGEPEFARLCLYFEKLTRALLDATTVGQALQQIAAAAVVLIPNARLVSITLREPNGKFVTPVATDEIAVELDQVQYRTSQGPCLDAARSNGPSFAASDDLNTETRWPYFSAAAVRLGLGSVLSTELAPASGPHQLSGALNIYASPHGLTADDKSRALLLATHAALALAHTRAIEANQLEHAHLRKAIASRDVIGQAKGILMGRRGLTAEEAFELLSRISQDLNVKLAELAATLVDNPDL